MSESESVAPPSPCLSRLECLKDVDLTSPLLNMRRTLGSAAQPESCESAALMFDAAAAEYTERCADTQRELAERCLALLGPVAPHSLLLDLGCGSGLSSEVLVRSGHACVGLDLSPGMLQLGPKGESVLADVGRTLPLRRSAFDGALSVSALQWLVADGGRERADALWRSLRASTRGSAKLVMQVYTPSEAHTELLLSAARASGFGAHSVVDFPHKTPAMKLFLCCTAEQHELPACALAWPRHATCAAAWVDAVGAPAECVTARHEAEHQAHNARLIRLLRRARAAPADAHAWPEDGGAPCTRWCARGAAATVTCGTAHMCEAHAAAAALRDGGWAADVRPSAMETVIAPAPRLPPPCDGDRKRRRPPRALRRAQLRQATQGTTQVSFCALPALPEGLRAGLMLLPDAFARGAISVRLHGNAVEAADAAMRAADTLQGLGHGVCAMELARADDDAAWELWCVIGGGWGRTDARRAAEVLAAGEEVRSTVRSDERDHGEGVEVHGRSGRN